MAKVISEGEVADILKISIKRVRKLFDKDVLSGFETEDGEWKTTDNMLQEDVLILTETARARRMQSGKHTSAWSATAPRADTPAMSPQEIQAALDRMDAPDDNSEPPSDDAAQGDSQTDSKDAQEGDSEVSMQDPPDGNAKSDLQEAQEHATEINLPHAPKIALKTDSQDSHEGDSESKSQEAAETDPEQ